MKTSGSKGVHVVVPVRGSAVRGRRGRHPRAGRAHRTRSTPSWRPPPTSRRTGTGGCSSTPPGRARARSSPPTARGSGPGCRCPRPVGWDAPGRRAARRLHRDVRGGPVRRPSGRPSCPSRRRCPADLVAEGHTIPIARVQAMHEGKRRKRAAAGRGRRRLTGSVPRAVARPQARRRPPRSVGAPAQAARMTHDPQTIAWLDQEDAHLAQVIRAHRWSVQYVGAGDEPDEPPFGYTVGLFGLGHPELVVVGLGPKSVHAILSRVAGLVADGRDLVRGRAAHAGPTGPTCGSSSRSCRTRARSCSSPTASTSAPPSTRCPPTSSPGRLPGHVLPVGGRRADEPDAQPRPGHVAGLTGARGRSVRAAERSMMSRSSRADPDGQPEEAA